MIKKEEIGNIGMYNELMELGIEDKLFFVDSLGDCDILVDFGCADGTLMSYISIIRPDLRIIGYDNCPTMIKLSNEKNKDNVMISSTTDWLDVISELMHFKSPGILLSSVIHEIISYGGFEEFEDVMGKVTSGDFKHIFIRDMMLHRSVAKLVVPSDDYLKIVNSEYSDLLESFESIWGSVENNYVNYIHFLHKFKYRHNWDGEVKENYFPIFIGDLLNQIPPTYYVESLDIYKYWYTDDIIKNEFDIITDSSATSHIKLIIRKE